MSNIDKTIIDQWRRDYRHNMSPRKARCESCRHLDPTPPAQNGAYVPPEGRCRLLDIVVNHVCTSVCHGWQSAFSERREAAKKVPPR